MGNSVSILTRELIPGYLWICLMSLAIYTTIQVIKFAKTVLLQ